MESVVIHIEDRAGGNSYSVSLHKVSDAGVVSDDPIATESIPVVWPADQCLLHDDTGEPLATPEELRNQVIRTDSTAAVLQGAGEFLYNLLMQGEIGTNWKQLAQAAQQEGGLRTYLDIAAKELQLLPWELLNDESPRPALFLDSKVSFVRGRPVADLPASCEFPIRILVIIACDAEATEIEWNKEIQGIKKACRSQRQLVDVNILKNPSRVKLGEEYNRFKPHVFHFIGHGVAGDGGDPYLEFEGGDDAAPKWKWNLNDIGIDLQEHVPELAFLNACHSGRPELQNKVWSIADYFVDLGTPAVVAMQGAISGPGAAILGAEFYKEIASGAPIDFALRKARIAIVQQCEGLPADWCLPSLRLNALAERVLRVQLPISSDEWEDVLAENRLLNTFVNREKQRRHIWKTFAQEKTKNPALLVLKGIREVGKTMMLRWCLEACTIQGHKVVYRDCLGAERMNFVELLRFIRDGEDDPRSSIWEKIRPASSFASFNRHLNDVLEPENSVDLADQNLDAGYELDKALGSENMMETIAKAFLASLKDVVNESPLTIALDHVNKENVFFSHFQNYFLRYILRPVSRGEVEGLNIILAVSTDQYLALGLDDLPRADKHSMEISPFSREEYHALATDFLASHLSHDQAKSGLVENVVEVTYHAGIEGNNTWMPHYLTTLAKLFPSG